MWLVAATERLLRNTPRECARRARHLHDLFGRLKTGTAHDHRLLPFCPWHPATSLQSLDQRTYFFTQEYGLHVSTLQQVEYHDWQVVVTTERNSRAVHDF